MTSTSHRNPQTSNFVDNTDWLKTTAIILVAVDHFGHFFMEDDRWWSVFGRLAAPTFFFLMGYAQTRTVPLYWIWLGVILTLLESWDADWTWVAPNILLSFALMRSARPYVQILLQRHGWVAFAFLVSALLAVLSIAAKIVDYGSEGWLWALFGLCQRMYVDSSSAADVDGPAQSSVPPAPAMKKTAGNATAGVLCRRGRLRMAGTKGILVSSDPVRRLHFRHRRLVRDPVSVPARPELYPTAKSHSRRPPLHRPAHSGNLRHPARLAGSELLVMLVPDIAP